MFKGGKVSPEWVAQQYKGIFELPALAGYGEFWRLHQKEADALAGPTARIANRLPAKRLEELQKYADPIALLLTAVAITAPRMEMTRAMLFEMRIQRETEARRVGLSRSIAGTSGRVSRSGNGSAAPGEDAPDTESPVPGSGEHVKDAYSED